MWPYTEEELDIINNGTAPKEEKQHVPVSAVR